MPYNLDIPNDAIDYLENLPLSESAKQTVFDALDSDVANLSDDFRADPANRHSAGATCLWYHLLLGDRQEVNYPVGQASRLSGQARRLSHRVCLNLPLALHDRDGDGRLHTLEFVVDDRSAAAGVLRIMYVDHKPGLPL